MSRRKMAIAQLIASFPAIEDNENHEATQVAYLMAVEDLSDTAVEHATRAYIRGGVDRKTHAFRPSPAEIGAFARRKQASLDSTQRTIANAERQINQKALPEPERPDEAARRAHVEAVLGRKVEHVKTANPPALLAADRKRKTPWRDPDVLQASMGRILDHLEDTGMPLHPKEADFIDKHNPEDSEAVA